VLPLLPPITVLQIKAKSKRDFVYKLNKIDEEADESYFWLELICEAEIINAAKLSLLLIEAKELTAIFTAQGRTAKANLKNSTVK
jgi:four helix bundle protein